MDLPPLPNSRPRTPLSQRLSTLVASSQSSPRSSPRSSLEERPPSDLDMLKRATTCAASVTKPRPLSVPVLKWLGAWSTQSPTQLHAKSDSLDTIPSPAGSSDPPSPSLLLLNDALSSPILPVYPTRAHLPEYFHASKSIHRPPPFLDNLTRSTLPTASLSSHYPPTPDSNVFNLSYSPPGKSSIDSLRSIRSMHTSAPAQLSPSPTRTWWFSDARAKTSTLLNEDDRGDTVQEENAKIRHRYRSPQNPIVFCHGLLGFDSVTIGPSIAPLQVTHWRGIKEVLEANGIEILITRVPATSSVVDRALVLEASISKAYPGRSVHLIGHSMGGIDCRYLISKLTHRQFKVLSLTTIATPHRGSSFADHFLSTIGAARMPSVLTLLDMLPNGGGDGKAFDCLTLEAMRTFNEDTLDDKDVRYFSWGAVYEPGLIDTWKWPHSVILEKEGPNDGLVSVESSKWGTYLGTLQHVNHLDLVGWINTARFKWAELMGKEIKFRPATFYLGIADYLAGEVEGQPEQPDSASTRSSHHSSPRDSLTDLGAILADADQSEPRHTRGNKEQVGRGADLLEEDNGESYSLQEPKADETRQREEMTDSLLTVKAGGAKDKNVEIRQQE